MNIYSWGYNINFLNTTTKVTMIKYMNTLNPDKLSYISLLSLSSKIHRVNSQSRS